MEAQQSVITRIESTLTQHINPEQRCRRFDGLSTTHIWAYGVGHFINDLTAACWFNYLLFFLKKVVKTDAASTALLAGQICDGIATPIIGMLSDKIHTSIGQRKPWYIGGLVIVLLCFIPLFSGFSSENIAYQYAFYIAIPGLFNIGWAAMQISHMSLAPALSCSRRRRDKLNNRRNLFTFISNFVVLGIGMIIFTIMDKPQLQYKLTTYISLAIGLLASIFFLCKIDEVKLTNICCQWQEILRQQIAQQRVIDNRLRRSLTSDMSTGESDDAILNQPSMRRQSKKDWFKMPKFYLFGICYTCVRLSTNIFGTLLPFFLIDVLKMGDSEHSKPISYNIALVPMIAYASSVLVSCRLDWFYSIFGRKKALFLGTALCITCLCIMFFLSEKNAWIMYVLGIFIGASQPLVLSTGMNLICDVVGGKAKTGAFVFGIYSLFDKFATGIVIFTIANTQSYCKESKDITQVDSDFIRLTTIAISGSFCLLSSLIILSYPVDEYNKDSKKTPALTKHKSEVEQELVV